LVLDFPTNFSGWDLPDYDDTNVIILDGVPKLLSLFSGRALGLVQAKLIKEFIFSLLPIRLPSTKWSECTFTFCEFSGNCLCVVGCGGFSKEGRAEDIGNYWFRTTNITPNCRGLGKPFFLPDRESMSPYPTFLYFTSQDHPNSWACFPIFANDKYEENMLVGQFIIDSPRENDFNSSNVEEIYELIQKVSVPTPNIEPHFYEHLWKTMFPDSSDWYNENSYSFTVGSLDIESAWSSFQDSYLGKKSKNQPYESRKNDVLEERFFQLFGQFTFSPSPSKSPKSPGHSTDSTPHTLKKRKITPPPFGPKNTGEVNDVK